MSDKGCSCGQDKELEGCNCNQEEDEDRVTLELDDGTKVECTVLTIFPVGEFEYIALLPMTAETTEEEDEEGEVFLYRYKELENGEIDLQNIEDDDEYEKVADAFDEMLDEAEFDDLEEDDK